MTEPIIEALTWFLGIIGVAGTLGLLAVTFKFSEEHNTKATTIAAVSAILLFATSVSAVAYLQAIEPIS